MESPCGCGWWLRMRMRMRIGISIADADADADAKCWCGCGPSMIDSIIHFLFTLRMRMRMRMRIEYELEFSCFGWKVAKWRFFFAIFKFSSQRFLDEINVAASIAWQNRQNYWAAKITRVTLLDWSWRHFQKESTRFPMQSERMYVRRIKNQRDPTRSGGRPFRGLDKKLSRSIY